LKIIELQSESQHVDNLIVENDTFVSPEVTSLSILTDVHAHDSDTSDAERELGVESTVTTVSYPLSSQSLKFLTMIHYIVSDFSSFSGCLEMCLESVSHCQSLLNLLLGILYISHFRFIRSHA